MDIYNINICEITNQFLKYISLQEELNIDVSSEYLVMASELMYLKSNELLPRKEVISNSSEEQELTKEDLINKLIEYKKYKEITNDFKDLHDVGSKYLMKLPTKIEVDNGDNSYENIYSIDSLVDAFNSFLKRKKEDEPF